VLSEAKLTFFVRDSYNDRFVNFDVLLTVHFSIILVISQLYEQNLDL